MNKISVLHIIGDSRYGGGAQIIFPLANRARQEGWQVDILTTDPVSQLLIRESGIGVVDLDVIHRPIRPLWDLGGLWRLTRYLRAHPYTIVHTHTSKAGLVGRIAATFAGIPVVVHTVHGFAFHEASSRSARWFYSTIERFAAHFCDAIVCVSRFHRQWALELGIGTPEKVIAIPNGLLPDRVQATKSRAEVREELGLQPDELLLFSAGRLAPQKGFEYLIRAVPQLARSLNRPFRVILAGEGELRPSLETLSRQVGAESHVQFLGFRHDIGNLLAATDLVILPSLWEGLSISLLEAMAAGKPIVTTRIGSNFEVVTDEVTALLVDSADIDQLTGAILRCAGDPELCQSMGRRAARHFLENYTYERMLDEYMNVYHRALEAKRLEPAYAPAH